MSCVCAKSLAVAIGFWNLKSYSTTHRCCSNVGALKVPMCSMEFCRSKFREAVEEEEGKKNNKINNMIIIIKLFISNFFSCC